MLSLPRAVCECVCDLRRFRSFKLQQELLSLVKKLSVVLQGRDTEQLEQPQPGLSGVAVLAGCFLLAHGFRRVNGTCSSQEHPLNSSCENTK